MKRFLIFQLINSSSDLSVKINISEGSFIYLVIYLFIYLFIYDLFIYLNSKLLLLLLVLLFLPPVERGLIGSEGYGKEGVKN